MNKDINRQLLDFIAASPTAFHAAENVAAALREAGFTELYESGEWKIAAPGDYFVRRNGSSLLAFRLPEDFSGFMIMAAHGDSPCFKIREGAEPKAAGAYRQLSVEKYGGVKASALVRAPVHMDGQARDQKQIPVDVHKALGYPVPLPDHQPARGGQGRERGQTL